MKKNYILLAPHYQGAVLLPAGSTVSLTPRQAESFADRIKGPIEEREKPLEVSTSKNDDPTPPATEKAKEKEVEKPKGPPAK